MGHGQKKKKFGFIFRKWPSPGDTDELMFKDLALQRLPGEPDVSNIEPELG